MAWKFKTLRQSANVRKARNKKIFILWRSPLKFFHLLFLTPKILYLYKYFQQDQHIVFLNEKIQQKFLSNFYPSGRIFSPDWTEISAKIWQQCQSSSVLSYLCLDLCCKWNLICDCHWSSKKVFISLDKLVETSDSDHKAACKTK